MLIWRLINLQVNTHCYEAVDIDDFVRVSGPLMLFVSIISH